MYVFLLSNSPNKYCQDQRSSIIWRRSHSWHQVWYYVLEPKIHFYFSSGLKIIRKMRPRIPPKWLISSFLVLLMTIGIIIILAGIKCCHIFNSKNSTFTLSSKGATNIVTASEGVADCILPFSKGDNNELTASEHTTYSMKDFEWDIKTLSACFKDLLLCLWMVIWKYWTHRFTSIRTRYFLFVTTQLLATFATIVENLSLDLFVKPTRASLQLI